MLINEVNGEAHDIEIRAVHGGAGNVTNPFLYAVRTGFVEGLISAHIVRDLVVGEVFESDIGAINNRFYRKRL